MRTDELSPLNRCKVFHVVFPTEGAGTHLWRKYWKLLSGRKSDFRRLLRNLLCEGHCREDEVLGLLNRAKQADCVAAVEDGNRSHLASVFDEYAAQRRLHGNPIEPETWGEECLRVESEVEFARRIVQGAERQSRELEHVVSGLGRSWLRRLPPRKAIHELLASRILNDLAALEGRDRTAILRATTIGAPIESHGIGFAWVTNSPEVSAAFEKNDLGLIETVCRRLVLRYPEGRKVLLRYPVRNAQSSLRLKIPTLFDVPWTQGGFRSCPCRFKTGRTAPEDRWNRGFPEAIHESVGADRLQEFVLQQA